MKTLNRFEELLEPWARGELSQAERAEFEAILDLDPELRAEAEDHRAVMDIIATEEPIKAPAGLVQAALAKARAESETAAGVVEVGAPAPAGVEEIRPLSKVWFYAAAAAVLVMAGGYIALRPASDYRSEMAQSKADGRNVALSNEPQPDGSRALKKADEVFRKAEPNFAPANEPGAKRAKGTGVPEEAMGEDSAEVLFETDISDGASLAQNEINALPEQKSQVMQNADRNVLAFARVVREQSEESRPEWLEPARKAGAVLEADMSATVRQDEELMRPGAVGFSPDGIEYRDVDNDGDMDILIADAPLPVLEVEETMISVESPTDLVSLKQGESFGDEVALTGQLGESEPAVSFSTDSARQTFRRHEGRPAAQATNLELAYMDDRSGIDVVVPEAERNSVAGQRVQTRNGYVADVVEEKEETVIAMAPATAAASLPQAPNSRKESRVSLAANRPQIDPSVYQFFVRQAERSGGSVVGPALPDAVAVDFPSEMSMETFLMMLEAVPLNVPRTEKVRRRDVTTHYGNAAQRSAYSFTDGGRMFGITGGTGASAADLQMLDLNDFITETVDDGGRVMLLIRKKAETQGAATKRVPARVNSSE